MGEYLSSHNQLLKVLIQLDTWMHCMWTKVEVYKASCCTREADYRQRIHPIEYNMKNWKGRMYWKVIACHQSKISEKILRGYLFTHTKKTKQKKKWSRNLLHGNRRRLLRKQICCTYIDSWQNRNTWGFGCAYLKGIVCNLA